MRLRNKAKTWYRGGGLVFAPGEVREVPDHEAMKLMEQLPWHFEKVVGASGAGALPPASEPRGRDREASIIDPGEEHRGRKRGR